MGHTVLETRDSSEKRHAANSLFYRFIHSPLAPSEEKITETKDCCIKTTRPEKSRNWPLKLDLMGTLTREGVRMGRESIISCKTDQHRECHVARHIRGLLNMS